MRRLFLGASLTAIAMFFGSSSASAAGTAATCELNGATGNLAPSVQQVGGTGNFTFSGSVACQVHGAPVIGSISASGTYYSIACGYYLQMKGYADIPGIGARQLTIDVLNFTGVVFAPDLGGNGAIDRGVAGAVEVIPTGPDTSPGNCVSVFTVVGAFSVD